MLLVSVVFPCCAFYVRLLSFLCCVFARVMYVVTFFGGKKSNQKKPPGKKASVFPGWCYYERQCYCAAGLIGSDNFCFSGRNMT